MIPGKRPELPVNVYDLKELMMSTAGSNKNTPSKSREDARNEDPLTGEPGSHPVGTGIGAVVGGAAAGAAAGLAGGPIGAAVGTVVGAVAGGYGGKAIAESVDPTEESTYWRENFRSRPYYSDQYDYETYEPAYRMGWEAYDPSLRFEDRESELQKSWEAGKRNAKLQWDTAKNAARDAWDRVANRRKLEDDCCSGEDTCDPSSSLKSSKSKNIR